MTDLPDPIDADRLATPDELNAWADEAQAIVDAGDMPSIETRKARTCISLLREAALRATRRDEPEPRVVELKLRNYDYALEFCKGAFGPFVSDVSQYADIVTNLLDQTTDRALRATRRDEPALRFCDYCKSWNNKPCGNGCVWSPTAPTVEALAHPAASQGAREDEPIDATEFLLPGDCPVRSAAQPMREALRHAQVRFQCLAEYFQETGDDVLWAMSEVDAERMEKALTPASANEVKP